MRNYLLIFLIFTFNSVYSSELDNASKLRTLFTSPDVRHQLDLLRKAGKYSTINASETSKPSRKSIEIKAQGIVIRENKPPVIFINNKNTIKSNFINSNIKIGNIIKQSYKIPVSVNNKAIRLLPGQTWHESDNKIKESYLVDHSHKTTDSIDKNIETTVNTTD
ncbi:hypothetical protein MNBD_GAMMA09-1939 [hydrothermal vent metagenome]|uniref:Uncharacterized protein n=1 Tax=hydrothermal vent metagenome TaxID=652676 RepID=A0A3B0Y0R0_9ZZZZ